MRSGSQISAGGRQSEGEARELNVDATREKADFATGSSAVVPLPEVRAGAKDWKHKPAVQCLQD